MNIYDIESKYSVKFVIYDTPSELSCFSTSDTIILFNKTQQLKMIHQLGFKRFIKIDDDIRDISELSEDMVKVISVYMSNMTSDLSEVFSKRDEHIKQIKELGDPIENLKEVFNKLDNKDYNGLTDVFMKTLPGLRNYLSKFESTVDIIDNDTYTVRYEMLKNKLTSAEKELEKYKEKISELNNKISEDDSDSLKELLSDLENKNRGLKNTISDLQTQLSESVDRNTFESYRAENETLRSKLDTMIDADKFNNCKSENDTLKLDIESVKNENEELKNQLSTSVPKESYENILKENEELSTQLKGVSLNGSSSSPTSMFNSDNTALVEKLLKQITDLRANRGIIETDLPFLTDQTPLLASHIFVLKEIKHMPFMNALIDLIRYKIANTCKDTLLIVYDKLDNYYTKYKYERKDFSINSTPICGVVITNNISPTFLRDVCSIEKWKRVILIDRLGYAENICSIKRAKYFYFIDSNRDLTDFNLKSSFCVTNFIPKKPEKFAGVISCDETMGNEDHSYRVSDLGKNTFVKQLFL